MSVASQMMLMAKGQLPDVVYLVTTAGTGSYTTPAGYSKVTIEAIGAGGSGTSTGFTGVGGGGGAYAKTENLTVTGGSTVVYYQVGNYITTLSEMKSWARVGTNAEPTSTSDGCLGYCGTDGAGGGDGGDVVNSVGTTRYAGANGTAGFGATVHGGGAGGDGGAGSGTTGGGSGDMKGGDGGSYSDAGTVGTAPGGGGSGKGSSGYVNGAIGRVRITFKVS